MRQFVWMQTNQTAEDKVGPNVLLTRISSPNSTVPSRYTCLTMRFALFAGLASLVSSATATALTYRLEANEKACFFTNVEQSNAKVAFYFAVRPIDYPSNTFILRYFIVVAELMVNLVTPNVDIVQCRFNLAVPSMSTTPSPHRAARSF